MTFTTDELIRIAAALAATAPSGGGSPNFHLSRRIQEHLGKAINDDHFLGMVIAASNVAISEYAESFGLTRLELADLVETAPTTQPVGIELPYNDDDYDRTSCEESSLGF